MSPFLLAAIGAAKNGARIVVIGSKTSAKRTHADILAHGGGTRDGDTWRFGKGAIEVRT